MIRAIVLSIALLVGFGDDYSADDRLHGSRSAQTAQAKEKETGKI